MKYTPILILLIFLSCQREHETGTPGEQRVSDYTEEVITISVDLTDIEEELFMSDFFSELHYVHLNPPDNKYIGRTEKIIVTDDYVALFDKSQYSVWIFTHEGEYINQVQIPEGRGPGEIIHITDVIITDNNYVKAMGALKIVVYNLDGEFIEETEIAFRAYSFTYDTLTEKYISYSGNSLNEILINEHAGKNIIKFDNSGNISESYLPIGEGREHIGFEVPNNFPTFNEYQRFFTHLVDTIYTIKNEGIYPEYVLDYGIRAIPEEVFARRQDYNMPVYRWADFWNNEIIANNYIAYLFYFNETDKWVHFRFGTRDKQFNAFYNKESYEVITGPGRFYNDIDYGYVPFIYESHGNALYTIIEANDLLRHLNEIYSNKPEKYADPDMRRVIELGYSLSDNSNPILQIATFKNAD